MILRRILFFLAGATALAVSAGVIVVALAYAVFALARPFMGPAGAAAVVALVAALLIGAIGLTLTLSARRPRRRQPEPENLMDAIAEFVKSKPVTAVGGALAAGLMAVRNPGYLGEMVRAFVEGNAAPKARRTKR